MRLLNPRRSVLLNSCDGGTIHEKIPEPEAGTGLGAFTCTILQPCSCGRRERNQEVDGGVEQKLHFCHSWKLRRSLRFWDNQRVIAIGSREDSM